MPTRQAVTGEHVSLPVDADAVGRMPLVREKKCGQLVGCNTNALGIAKSAVFNYMQFF